MSIANHNRKLNLRKTHSQTIFCVSSEFQRLPKQTLDVKGNEQTGIRKNEL